MDAIAQDAAILDGTPAHLSGAQRAHAALCLTRPNLAGTDMDELGPDVVGEEIVDLIVDLLHLAHRNGGQFYDVLRNARGHYGAEAPECVMNGHSPVEDAALGNPCRDCGIALTFNGTEWEAGA